MKCTKVVVTWPDGLHLRRAARLIQVAKGFRSTIWLKCNGGIADARNILGLIALCATMGTAIVVEASGDDEQEATAAIAQVFAWSDSSSGGS